MGWSMKIIWAKNAISRSQFIRRHAQAIFSVNVTLFQFFFLVCGEFGACKQSSCMWELIHPFFIWMDLIFLHNGYFYLAVMYVNRAFSLLTFSSGVSCRFDDPVFLENFYLFIFFFTFLYIYLCIYFLVFVVFLMSETRKHHIVKTVNCTEIHAEYSL